MAEAQVETKEKAVSEKRDKYIVAAIDFGTTYSGYAFSLKHDFKNDPTKNIVTNVWGASQLMSHKAPTCVLFDENGKFHSFGYEAEENYGELALEEDEGLGKWYFFQRFKMKLHEQKIHRDMNIKDVKGKEMSAKTVFRECISFLKGHLLEALRKKATTFTLDEIHWVLTVPAIWSDAAKQFMREAAQEAGINGALLSIALEPEAASLYCQHQHIEQDQQSAVLFDSPKAGTKYAVIDLGGGTVDITVHEKQENGTLKELTQPSGGAWGGMYVNMEFQNFLISLFGADIYTEFKETFPASALEIQRDFESKKRLLKPKDDGKKITICSVQNLLDLYKEKYKEDLKIGINKHPHANKIQFVAGGRLRMDAKFLKGFFKPCLDKMVCHIKELVEKPAVKDTKVFLLVGGFSESDIVFAAVKDALPGASVINPPEPGLAVLKGAVIFGHSPVAVSSRIARFSIGVSISPPFDESVHPKDREVTIGGVSRCKNVFKNYIEKGTCLNYGMHVLGKHVTVEEYQAEMVFRVYVSTKKRPRFCDEADTDYAGKLVVPLPRQKERIIVEVRIIVGETELKVEAEEQSSRNKFPAYFEFL